MTDNLKVGFQFNGARMLPADTKSVATALRAAPVAHVFNSSTASTPHCPDSRRHR